MEKEVERVVEAVRVLVGNTQRLIPDRWRTGVDGWSEVCDAIDALDRAREQDEACDEVAARIKENREEIDRRMRAIALEAVGQSYGVLRATIAEVEKRVKEIESGALGRNDAQWEAAMRSAETRLYGIEAEVKRMLEQIDALDRSLAKPGEGRKNRDQYLQKEFEDKMRELAREEIAKDNIPTPEDSQAFHRTEMRWRAVERKIEALEAKAHDPKDIEDRGREHQRHVDKMFLAHHVRLSALESRGLGVGEKGGGETGCSTCDARGYLRCIHVVTPPAPAPSRAPGNGETAEERYQAAIEASQARALRRGALRSRIIDLEAFEAAESAARRLALEEAETLPVLPPRGCIWRDEDGKIAQALRVYRQNIRALLAGGQEVAS